MSEDEIEAILRAAGAEYRHMGRGVNAWCMDGDLMPMIEALLAAPVAPADPAEGWVLVPKRMTQEMRDVTDSEGWTWEDLLAEAGSISQEEYAAIAAAPVAPAELIADHVNVIRAAIDTIMAVVDQRREPGWSYRNTITHNRIAIREQCAAIDAALAAPVAPAPYFNRQAVERAIEAMKAPQPGMQINDNKERPTLPVGTLERMLKIIDTRGGA